MGEPRLRQSRDLDVAGVIRQCAIGWVPVNVSVDVAIAAHRAVGTENALRVLILAMTPTVEDCRKQLDYLAALPESAWRHDPSERDAVLAMIRRVIGWRQEA